MNSVSAVPTRKRVVKACDSCKRRKTKCDAGSPCSSCAAVGLQCFYSTATKQIRGAAYVAHLESKVKQYEEQADSGRSNSDNGHNRPQSSAGSTHDASFGSGGAFSNSSSNLLTSVPSTPINSRHSPQQEFLEPIMCEDANIILPNPETLSYYGSSSGMEVLRRMGLYLDKLIGPAPSLVEFSASQVATKLDRRLPLHSSEHPAFPAPWPSKLRLQHHVDLVFSNVFCLWPVVDRSLVDWAVEQLHKDAGGPINLNNDYTALLYSIVALGERLEPFNTDYRHQAGISEDMRGLEYLGAARKLVNPQASGRSVAALQAVLCMSIFLISASAVTTAHSYIGSAASAALRMNLHDPDCSFRSAPDHRLNAEMTYRTLRALDAYIASLLGLPRSLLTFGRERETTPPQTNGQSPPRLSNSIADAHVKLWDILGAALESTYFSCHTLKYDGSYCRIPRAKIGDFITKLDEWKRSTPAFSASDQVDLKERCLLYYAHAYVQLLVFTPFLPYINFSNSEPHGDGYTVALKCMEAAVQAIQAVQLLQDGNIFNMINSFGLHGLIFAAITLLGVQLGVADKPEVEDTSKSAEVLLEKLAVHNLAARACIESLQPFYALVDQSGNWLRQLMSIDPLALKAVYDDSMSVLASQRWTTETPD